MADELSTPSVSRWGYVVLDYVGLGFILIGPEEWVRVGSWKGSLVYIAIGAAFLFLGIMGPKIKAGLATRLPWVRLKKELEAALVRIEELKANQRPSFWETITKPGLPSSSSVPKSPDLKIEYRQNGSERPRLVFKIRSGAPTTIRKVGPLVSEETYRTESNFVLLQDVIPELEVDHPVECQISCLKNPTSGDLVSLKDVLEDGGPAVSDSTLIEYTADGHQYSRRFFLYKNADGSVVWSPEDRQPDAQDLRALRNLRRSLQDAISNLIFVGQITALERDSESLESQLSEILDSTPTGEINSNHPLTRENISLDFSETLLPLLGRLRLMSFRDRYNHFVSKCTDLWLHRNTAVPNLPNLPNELTRKEFIEALLQHRAGLNHIRTSYTRQYAASFAQAPH